MAEMAKMVDRDQVFTGSIPTFYDTYLVPLIFAPYAADLAQRLRGRRLGHVLEVAAGTGVVTRELAATLDADTAIVATDLNQAMLDHGAAVGTARPVEWRAADAMALPFPDAAFDAVVCQFGVMFFPDRAKAYAEALRVLRPGGLFLFNAWDRIEENEFADTVTRALAACSRTIRRASWRARRTAITTGDDRARPRRRRLHSARGADDGRGAQPRAVAAPPGAGVLPGNAVAQRDRGSRRDAPCAGHRRRGRSGCTAVRARRGRRQDPGARRGDRALNGQAPRPGDGRAARPRAP